MRRIKHLLLITCLVFLCSSCVKKILDVIPVIEVERNMSIPGAKDIKYFSFPSSQVGYAASDTSFIYKTTDGGNTWTTTHIVDGKKCRGLEFFDELTGVCLMGKSLYRTDDGGQTWSPKGSADFIGKTDDGKGVSIYWGYNTCSFYVSTNKGQNFLLVGSIEISGDFTSARLVDSRVIVFYKDVYLNHRIEGFDIENGNTFTIKADHMVYSEHLNDIYLSKEETGVAVGSEGIIMDNPFTEYNDLLMGSNNLHLYTYYSVDGYGDLAVAVGEKTIATNLYLGNDKRWNDVFYVSGNGFDNTFYKIRFIDQARFYLSGSNGYLVIAKI